MTELRKLTNEAVYLEAGTGFQPRPRTWETPTLPTELPPLSNEKCRVLRENKAPGDAPISA